MKVFRTYRRSKAEEKSILLCISDLITDPEQSQNCMYAGERGSKDYVEEGEHGEVIAAVSINVPAPVKANLIGKLNFDTSVFEPLFRSYQIFFLSNIEDIRMFT